MTDTTTGTPQGVPSPTFDACMTAATIRLNLDRFTRGYISAALWSSHIEPDGSGDMMDAIYDETNIALETLKSMIADCDDFQNNNDALQDAYDADITYGAQTAGFDFWLTRNGHGAGFWDRGLGSIGEELSEMARPYGSVDLYVGDDGLIYA